MSEDAYGRLGKKLRRILLVLPYAIKHPGVTVAELSRKFSMEHDDLIEDLHMVFLCGLPGYGPGDLIDVTVEDDRVYVRMADYFSEPLRLSPVEALTLYAGGQALASLEDMAEADSLRRALDKLAVALGADGGGGVSVDMDAVPAGHIGTLRAAIDEGKRIKLEYLSATRGELTERTVDPWGLIAALGRWYLVAWDHLQEDERLFRTDRIKSAVPTDEPAEIPGDFDPARYRGAFMGGAEGEMVVLELSPRAARWFEDYYPVEASEELADGWQRVSLRTSGNRWAATLLLRLGDDVRAAEPGSVTNEARQLAGAIVARY